MSRTGLVSIDPRFRGPPESANGGYVCGMIGIAAGEPVSVRLRRPPPLGLALRLEETDDGLRLLDGEHVVATARPDAVDVDVPVPPDHAEAIAASLGYIGFTEHPFPGCFVCGPRRLAGDGLRIFPGPVSGRPMVAAPWVPDGSLADAHGSIRPEFVWAALDCPGYFATPLAGRIGLLGELAARIDRAVEAGEPCVVVGWQRFSEERRHHVGTAVFGRGGELLARARAVWVEPKS